MKNVSDIIFSLFPEADRNFEYILKRRRVYSKHIQKDKEYRTCRIDKNHALVLFHYDLRNILGEKR